MATMTFQINDASTGGTNPAVWVTVTENPDGTLSFEITQEGGVIGDLRGLFFDLADESILKSLVVTAASTDIRIGDDSIKDLGDGANMNGLTGTDKGYDVGIEIGTAGIGANDIRSYSFTLDSTARDLTLRDFANVDFAARLTSVGVISGARADSSKLLENTSAAIDLQNAAAVVLEDQVLNGNALGSLNLAGNTIITGWSGGDAGTTLALESEGDIIGTIQLNQNGSFVLDARAADELSAGESIEFNFDFNARNQDEVTSWSTDSAKFKVVIQGVNDGPVAGDDSAVTQENALVTQGSVLGNDSDVDRLDVISATAWSGGALGETIAIDNGAGATFTLNADGSYVLDGSQANALSAGETIRQTFSYTLADNHGATDGATIDVVVTGVNDGPDAQNDAAGEIAEAGSFQGGVLGNDSDIDRLDVLTVSAVNGQALGTAVALASGATVTMNTDGTYTYNTNGAFDALNDGEWATDSFQYTIDDGHGGSDTATVSLSIAGHGTPVSDDVFPNMAQNISNVVLYLDDGDATTDILKIKLQPEGLQLQDVDLLNISQFIATHGEVLGGNTDLVGISIHAGQEYPNLAGTDMTAQGEGAFYFLLDGETPAVEAIGTRDKTWTFDWTNDDIPLTQAAKDAGLSYELLAEQAQIVYTQYDADAGVWMA